MKIRQFKMRASGAGIIMGAKGLGQTGLTYLDNWAKGQYYNRHIEIKSKYLDKGNIMEDNSLDEVAKRLGIAVLLKNEKHYENKFLRGTPDAIHEGIVIDVKNSWSWETFPLMDVEPNKNYYWQLQSYMALTDLCDAKLVYTLLDTPAHLIEREAYYYCMKNGYEELDESVHKKFISKMTYSDVPEELKYRCFEIRRNQEDIDKLYARVKECRKEIRVKLKTLKF